MSVSANTLFHFTNFDAVQSILESQGFWPRYSLEILDGLIPDDSPFVKSYVPMVSFCDLKLLQILNSGDSKHTHHFGKCGIGLSKVWGIDRRVSPVSYVHHNSVASRAITEIIHQIRKISKSQNEPRLLEAIIEQIKFLKAYEGRWQKGTWHKRKIRFYDEREWRFVPRERGYPAISNENERVLFVDDYNEELKKSPLKFGVDDVKLIVLEHDKQKLILAEMIHKQFNHLSADEKNNLIACILTIKELQQDY